MRLVRAVALIVVMVAACCVADGAGHAAASAATEMRASAVGVRYMLASGDDRHMQDMAEDAEDLVFRLYDGNAGTAGVQWGQLPDGFVREVVDPAAIGAGDVVAAHGTVGLVCGGAWQDVRNGVDSMLCDRGWQRAESGADVPCDTYVKAEGDYRWTYVVYSEVSGTVTVTVSTMQAQVEGGDAA